MDKLMHYGIQGQKWGVRRYQNPDRTWTEEGKLRYSHAKTVKRIDSVYKSMSKKERYYLTREKESVSYANLDEHSKYVVKSFLKEIGNKPVGFLDVWQSGESTGTVAIGVRNGFKYRGHGIGSKLVEEALDWFENESNMSNLYWDAHSSNAPSNALAKKYGFEEVQSVNNGWKTYRKSKK